MKLRTLVRDVIEAWLHVEPGDSRTLAEVPLQEATYRVIKVNRDGETFVLVANPWGDAWRLPVDDDEINQMSLYVIGQLTRGKGDQVTDDSLRSFVKHLVDKGEPVQFRDPKTPRS